MSIIQIHHDYIVECDECYTNLGSFLDFNSALDAIRESEWTTRKSKDGDWINLCPKCQKEEFQW